MRKLLCDHKTWNKVAPEIWGYCIVEKKRRTLHYICYCPVVESVKKSVLSASLFKSTIAFTTQVEISLLTE